MMRLNIWIAAIGILSGALLADTRAEEPLKLGMQTWTLRNLSFEQAVDFCVKHKIKYLELIPNHIDPNGSKEEWRKKKDLLDKNGLVAYTFGVAGTSMNKEENRKLFEFAKFFGMKLIVVEPGDYRILDNLEELAKEYDIRVAIHGHHIKSPYGNPLVVRNLLKMHDKHIGVCMDTGWVASSRSDVPKVFEEYQGRVYDIHLKDKKVECTSHGDESHDTILGQGDAKLAELLKVLEKDHYDGVMAIETDLDLKDPTDYVEKGIEFVKQHE